MQPTADKFWPATLVGWLTTIAAVFGIGGGLWAYAKFLVHLNGLGDRVNKAETRLDKMETRISDFAVAVEKLIDHHRTLTQQVAESRAETRSLDEKTMDIRVDVGGFIADLKSEVNKTVGDLREIVAGLRSDVANINRGRGHA